MNNSPVNNTTNKIKSKTKAAILKIYLILYIDFAEMIYYNCNCIN